MEEKLRKQVWFEVDKELGDKPNLPSDLTLFLAEGTTPKQGNASSLPAQLPTPTKSTQHGHAPTGGARPKVLAVMSHGQSHCQPQTRPERERPDPVKYPCQWIADEMSQASNPHPHW